MTMHRIGQIHKATHGLFACTREKHLQDTPSQGLPQDISREASHRLGVAGVVYAVTYFMAYFAGGTASWMTEHSESLLKLYFLAPRSLIAWAAILLGLGIFALSRSSRFSPRKLLDIGLVFMVVGAAGISCTTFWGVFPEGRPDYSAGNQFMGVPWESVWIILFPVIAPNKPIRILIAALAAASTGLTVTLISRYTGATSPECSYWWLTRYFLFTTYLCAFLAWFNSMFIHKLGTHLRQARDIGSYQLDRKLGSGGMGEVWLAKHRMLARPAAIKLIKPEVLGRDETGRQAAIRRFEREAQATALLQSPHTIRLYDFGGTSEGSFYYVMELLNGISLDQLVIKYGPQPPARVVFILKQICHSLHDAHQNKMIHRDIKPGNLLTCALGQDYDFVKVLDFGLVKSTTKSSSLALSLTQTEIACGTPGYLSPEMALARADIDGRADLYSLGCVAYWLLTGTPVFEGETALATAAMHLKDAPVPPSQRSEFEIPAGLEQIILDCLAKEPADRPTDARILAERLDSCLPDQTWDTDAARQWWQINNPGTVDSQEQGVSN